MLYLEKTDQTVEAELRETGVLSDKALKAHLDEVAGFRQEKAHPENIRIYAFDAKGLSLSRPGQSGPESHLPLAFAAVRPPTRQLILDGRSGFPRRLIDPSGPSQLWVTPQRSYLIGETAVAHPWALTSQRLLSPDGNFELLVSTSPDYVLLSDRREGCVLQLCPHRHCVIDRIQVQATGAPLEMALHGDTLWFTAGTSALLLWHLRSSRFSRFELRLGTLGALSMAPNPRYLLLQADTAQLHLLDSETLESRTSQSLLYQDTFAAEAPAGSLLLTPDQAHWLLPVKTAEGLNGVQLIDTRRLQAQQRLVFGPEPLQLSGCESLQAFGSHAPNLATRLYQLGLLPAELSLPNIDLGWPFATRLEIPQAPWPLPPATTDVILELLKTPLPQGLYPPEQAALKPQLLAELASSLRQQLEQAQEARSQGPVWGSELVLRRNQVEARLTHSGHTPLPPGPPGHALLPLSETGMIVLLNPQGEVVWSLDLKPLGLHNPSDVRLLPQQRLLITDPASARVCEVNFAGEIIWEMGPDQGLVRPLKTTWLCRESGLECFAIIDQEDTRILACNRTHSIEWEYRDLHRPCEIQTTGQESFLITDSGLNSVLELDTQGHLLGLPGAGMALVAPLFAQRHANGRLLVFDAAQKAMISQTPQGEITVTPINLPQPEFITSTSLSDPDELVVVSREGIAAWSVGTLEAIWSVNPLELQTSTAATGTLPHDSRLEFLAAQPLFAGLPETILTAMAAVLTSVRYSAGSILLRQDEPGEALYIIQSGHAEVLNQGVEPESEVTIERLEAGELFGEVSLIFDEPRSNTIRAASEIKLLRLSKQAFYQLGRDYPELLNHLKQLAQERRYLVQLRRMDQVQARAEAAKVRFALERLRQLHAFEGLSSEILDRLQPYLHLKTYPAGSLIFAAGDSGDELFFISIGNLEVLVDGKCINVLPEGEVFGEIALVLDTPRTASIRAQSYCELYSLDRASFAHAISPELHERLEALAQQRLQRSASGNYTGATATALDLRSKEIHYPESLWGQGQFDTPVYMITPDQRAVAAIDARGRDSWHYGLHDYRLLLQPFSVVEAQGRVLIADRGNHRILVLDPIKRALVESVGDDRLSLLNPTCAAPGPDGSLLIADQGRLRLIEVKNNEIVWLYADPQQLLSPVWIDAGPERQVLYVDEQRHQVVLLDRQGQQQWSYGIPLHPGNGYFQLNRPRFAVCLPEGNVLIADTGNDRLLEVSPAGTVMQIFTGSPAHPMQGPLYARRLANGHTLVVHHHWHELLELDGEGRAVWSCRLEPPTVK